MQYHETPVFQQLIERIESSLPDGMTAELSADILQLRDFTTLTDDPTVLAASQVYMAFFKWHDGNRDECVAQCKNALSVGIAYDSPSLPYFTLRAYALLTTVYAAEGDCYAALGSCLNAYHIAGAHPEYRFESALLHQIGCLFMDMSQPALALGYLTNAYDCQREQALPQRTLLAAIVLDIIAAYSSSLDFEQAARWANEKNIAWTAQERTTVDCRLLVNKAEAHRHDSACVTDALTQFFALAKTHKLHAQHLYRCYLLAAEQCIEHGERDLADRALAALSSLQDFRLSPLLRHQSDALRVEYYRKFIRDTQTGGDAFWEPFFQSSLELLNRLQANYLSSLLLELELDQSKFLNNSVLRRSFHMEKDLELDPLTGLLNHASTEKYIEERLSAREDGSYQAILILRINDFKSINDAFGHHYGDMLLLQIADILNTRCSSDALVGRWEGDQYLIFLGHARNAPYVSTFAETLIAASEHIPLPDKAIRGVSISVVGKFIDRNLPLQDTLSALTEALETALADRFQLLP